MSFDELGLQLKKHYLMQHPWTDADVYFTPLSKGAGTKGCFRAIVITSSKDIIVGPASKDIDINYIQYMYSPWKEITKADWTKLQLKASNDLQSNTEREMGV